MTIATLMDINVVMAKRIKIARIERDMRQIDLAEALGTNQQYVTKIESGRVSIRVDTLERIARALGKPMSFFLQEFEEAPLPKKSRSHRRAKEQVGR